MPRTSKSKRLTSCKNKTYYATKKKQVKENREPVRLTTPLNDISLNEALKTRTINEDNVLQPSIDDSKDLQELTHNDLSSPSATSRCSPVPPNLFPNESVLLISPSTGLLKNREVYSIPHNSTYDQSNDSFADTPYEEVRLESPQPAATLTELLINTQPAQDKSADKVFTVSSMCVLDTATSGMYPSTPIEKPLKARTAPSTSDFSSCELVDLLFRQLRLQLPSPWMVAANRFSTCIFVQMVASDEMWSIIQRIACISTDGTVQLDVHRRAISLSHPIWEDLPRRVGLTNQESVDDFLKYVLEVVYVIRSYVVCMAIHESGYFKVAAKRKDLVFETYFKESRCSETYRPAKCELLLSTKNRLRKYCNTCWGVRREIMRQFRNMDSAQAQT